MRRCAPVVVLLTLCAPSWANEGLELALRTKSVVSQPVPASHVQAPFRNTRDPMPELLLREELESRIGPRGGCLNVATALCYDSADGRVVYRGARRYMPEWEGVRAESISLRRDRIIFKYSFR